MRTADLTLDVVKREKLANSPVKRSYRLSDFVSSDEMAELEAANILGKPRKSVDFDVIDAVVGEVIARFGWDTYKAWLSGEIEHNKMMRLLEAERCREKGMFLGLESALIAAISSCAQGKKGLRVAQKIVKRQQKEANRGGRK